MAIPTAPVITSPASGATLTGDTLIEWSAVEEVGSINYRDDFVDTDDVLLENHTATWEGGAGIGSMTKKAGNSASITSNRLHGHYDDPIPEYYLATAPSSADCEIVTMQYMMSTLAYPLQFLLRWNRASTSYYVVNWVAGETDFNISRVISGTVDYIHAGTNDPVWNQGETKEVKIRVVTNVSGNPVITVWLDGVVQNTYEDTSGNKITAAGDVGIAHAGSSVHGLHINSMIVQEVV